jgi:hypothetical protein
MIGVTNTSATSNNVEPASEAAYRARPSATHELPLSHACCLAWNHTSVRFRDSNFALPYVMGDVVMLVVAMAAVMLTEATEFPASEVAKVNTMARPDACKSVNNCLRCLDNT